MLFHVGAEPAACRVAEHHHARPCQGRVDDNHEITGTEFIKCKPAMMNEIPPEAGLKTGFAFGSVEQVIAKNDQEAQDEDRPEGSLISMSRPSISMLMPMAQMT